MIFNNPGPKFQIVAEINEFRIFPIHLLKAQYRYQQKQYKYYFCSLYVFPRH